LKTKVKIFIKLYSIVLFESFTFRLMRNLLLNEAERIFCVCTTRSRSGIHHGKNI